MVYSSRVMLQSVKTDSLPTTQKSCVAYENVCCQCEVRYVGRTTQRLADRMKQHVPTSIREKSSTVKEQPPRLCKSNNSKINCESAIGQHLLTNLECGKTYTEDNFWIIGQARSCWGDELRALFYFFSLIFNVVIQSGPLLSAQA